jgi:tetratricopeptide (TPR) repeat protein
VLACADRAAEHWRDSTPFTKAVAIQLRGRGHLLNKDYPAAITAHREALDINRSISPESDDVAIELNWLANAEKANKDYAAAERDYREALRIAKIIKNDEGIALYTGNLATLALDREQWAEAESLAREALALSEKVGRLELPRRSPAQAKCRGKLVAKHPAGAICPTGSLIAYPPRRRDFHAPASSRFAVSAGNVGGD